MVSDDGDVPIAGYALLPFLRLQCQLADVKMRAGVTAISIRAVTKCAAGRGTAATNALGSGRNNLRWPFLLASAIPLGRCRLGIGATADFLCSVSCPGGAQAACDRLFDPIGDDDRKGKGEHRCNRET